MTRRAMTIVTIVRGLIVLGYVALAGWLNRDGIGEADFTLILVLFGPMLIVVVSLDWIVKGRHPDA